MRGEPSLPTAPVTPAGTRSCSTPAGQPHVAGTLTATSGSPATLSTTGIEYDSRLTHQWAARSRGSSRHVVAAPSGVFHGEAALNGRPAGAAGGSVVVGA